MIAFFAHDARLKHEFCQRDDRVATHRAIAFVVQKENIKVRVERRSDHRSIHVCMTARFPHRSGAEVVVVLAKIATLLEHRLAFDGRQTRGVNPQRLSAGMHVDRSDAGPMRRRLPLGEVKGLLHMRSGVGGHHTLG